MCVINRKTNIKSPYRREILYVAILNQQIQTTGKSSVNYFFNASLIIDNSICILYQYLLLLIPNVKIARVTPAFDD